MTVHRWNKVCLCGTRGSCSFYHSDSGTVLAELKQEWEGEGCKPESSWVLVPDARHMKLSTLKPGCSEVFPFFWALFTKMTDLKVCCIYDYLFSKLLNLYTSTAFHCLLVYCGSVLNLRKYERSLLSCKGKSDFKSNCKMMAWCLLADFLAYFKFGLHKILLDVF